jgi:hypothetical protein
MGADDAGADNVHGSGGDQLLEIDSFIGYLRRR